MSKSNYKKPKIILMGDSITEMMPYVIDKKMERGFNKPLIFNEAPELSNIFYICGSSNVGIGNFHKYHWPHVDKDNVDCFVLLLGINNINRPDCDYDGEDTLDNVYEKLKKFIIDIKGEGHKLLVQSIYPTKWEETNSGVLYINKRLMEYCNKNSIDYLDLYATLSNEQGLINPKYSDDGIHPNKLGYGVILKEICQRLKLRSKDKELPDLEER